MPHYNTYTYNSPLTIQRWVHNKRFEDAIELLAIKADDKVLDYGCGDGRLLELINDRKLSSTLAGYEPAEDMYKQALAKLDSAIHIEKEFNLLGEGFNKIACLETCEHLPPGELNELFYRIRRLADENALIIFSVPIETGIPAMIKNLYRKIRNDKKDQMSWLDYFKTIFGIKVERIDSPISKNMDYYFSHVGFSHRRFTRELQRYFSVKRTRFSPINSLKNFGGNTVFYICKIK